MKRLCFLVFLLFVSATFCSGQVNTASAQLSGRTVMGALPVPATTLSRDSGTVVVSVRVDQYGNVTKATPGADGTTLTDNALWTAARTAAMKAHFDMDANAPAIQSGTITYIFNGPEKTSLREFVEEKEYGEFIVRGTLDQIHDADDLVFYLNQDDYIIPIRLVKRDLGAVKRFRSLELYRGDMLTVRGTLNYIEIYMQHYKGLSDAVILDIARIPRLADQQQEEDGDTPQTLVVQKPSFNGGDFNEFSKWVNSRLVYPKEAKDNGIQGRVTLQFTIETDGRVTKVKVLRGCDPALDAEAVRVVKTSPKWKPGRTSDNKAVPVTITFPVIFSLR